MSYTGSGSLEAIPGAIIFAAIVPGHPCILVDNLCLIKVEGPIPGHFLQPAGF